MDMYVPWHKRAPELAPELAFAESADVGLPDWHGMDVKVWLTQVVPVPSSHHVGKVIVAICAANKP